MARRLILMRHAQQGGRAETDHARRLTAEGHQQAHRVGERLARFGPLPDQVLCSTAQRCRETWMDVSSALPGSIPVTFEAGLYNASADQLLDAIATVDEATERLLVLAHNPGISLLALGLAGARDDERKRLEREFSPSTTAIFSVEGEWSTLSPRTTRLQSFLSAEDDGASDQMP